MNNINTFNHHTSFQAYKVATARNYLNNKQTNIDIYKLTKKDKAFINKLENLVYIPDLNINISTLAKRRWQQVLNYGFLKARTHADTYIALSDNKPCGILVSYKNKKELCLDCISKFPLDINKGINYIGKSLFYQAFKDAKENNCDTISLRAILGGPYNVVEKYKKLGFKETGSVNNYINMECNKYKIDESLKELSQEIEYEKCDDIENIDLNKVCDII